jgi:hypothetical protein
MAREVQIVSGTPTTENLIARVNPQRPVASSALRTRVTIFAKH